MSGSSKRGSDEMIADHDRLAYTSGMRRSSRKASAIIGIVGIIIELVVIVLLASERISTAVAMPIMIAGMFLAFVPAFTLARSRRP